MDTNGAQTFGQFLKGYFKGLVQMLKHPLSLLPTLLISAAWIVLGIVHTRYGESQWLAWANFFTFAQGGLFGGTVGAVGGIVGKILIATLLNALIMPLFVKNCHPFARFGRGFGGFFKSFAFDSLRALSSFLFGLGLALLLYSIFNITQRWQESLVGVTAAILLIRSIGQRGGLIFSFLFSITKTFTKGKSPSYVGISRFLSGMVLGMTLAVGLNAFGLKWCVAFAAGALVLAFLFVWFGKRQRAVLTAVSVAFLLMVPVYADSPTPQSQEELKAASKKHAAELAPYLEEVNRAAQEAREKGGDAAEARLAEAQKRYAEAVARYARQDAQGQQVPQEMQDLINRASDYDGINKKVESLEKQYEQAAARNDQAEMDRIANEIAKVYMGQANDAMDLYKMAQEMQNQQGAQVNPATNDDDDWGVTPAGDVDTGGTGNPFFGDQSRDDERSGSDPNPFGIGPGANDLDWKPQSPDGGFVGAVKDMVDDKGLDSWADEDSRVDTEEDATELEGIGAGIAVGLGAGAAAGAGGAGGALGGGGGGGGGVPTDLPDTGGEWEATEPKEREDEDDSEEDEDEESEGGDGDEENEENEEPEGEEKPEESEEAEKGEQPEEQEPEQQDEEQAPEDQEPEEDDYDYEKERADREREQEEINKKYKDAFDKDAEKFKSTSDQERIEKEVAEDMKKWEEEEHVREIIQSVKDEAEEMGVPTKDADGNDRSMDDILDDMKDKYVKDTLRDNWREWQDTQMEAAKEELDASLALADAELVDNVSEGTVNVLAEYVPGGDKVKDFHTFTKSTMVGATEGYLKDGWTGAAKGGAAGAAEGVVGVAQNHLSDLTKGATGNEAVDKLAADVLNVQMEGVKVMIHDVSRGKSVEELYSDVQEATVKKTGDVLVGRILGDGLGMGDHDANAVGEIISKGHDDLKWGGNGNPEEDKTLAGNIASGWQNFKDKTAEKMCDLYYGNKD